MHHNAIVGIQRHDVGHGPQRHQIQQLGQIGLGSAGFGKPAALTQRCSKRQHDVENDPHARHRLAWKIAARLAGVDDGVGLGKLRARQMVVGNHYLQAGGPGRRYPFNTGDAVIHGHQHVRATGQRYLNNLRRQPIAVLKTVGYQVIHLRRPQLSQGQHGNAAGGGTVGIKVAHDQYRAPLAQCRFQHRNRLRDAAQPTVGQQRLQAAIQLGLTEHTTGGVKPTEQWRQLPERRQHLGQRAGFDAHQRCPCSHSRVSSCC